MNTLASEAARTSRHRSRRVVVLITGIVLLSLGDLLLTVTYLKSTGMSEANPVAGFLIRHTGSLPLLALYKALTVAVCGGVLFRLRRHVEGEVAAWCAVLILAVTSLHWRSYAREVDGLVEMPPGRQVAYGHDWLFLD